MTRFYTKHCWLSVSRLSIARCICINKLRLRDRGSVLQCKQKTKVNRTHCYKLRLVKLEQTRRISYVDNTGWCTVWFNWLQWVDCDVVASTETMAAAFLAFVCTLLYASSSASEPDNFFSLHPQNQSVTEGGTATFTCHADFKVNCSTEIINWRWQAIGRSGALKISRCGVLQNVSDV